MNRPAGDRPRLRPVPLIAVPLFWYLAVTLVAPLLNGAADNEGFTEHALTTLAVSLLGTAIWFAVRRHRARDG